MAVSLPADFNFLSIIGLDRCELFVRDTLKFDISEWAKFRETIHIGLDSNNLRTNSGTVAAETREAYRLLGKSHYEVVVSLGCAGISLQNYLQYQSHALLSRKSQKDFYFHLGCLLDNLARLIFIVNHPSGATERYHPKRRNGDFVRNWIDWGELGNNYIKKSQANYRGYERLTRSKQLGAVINLRNGFTHGWSPPASPHPTTGIMYWPTAIRRERNPYWPHDKEEQRLMRRAYRSYAPILGMMESDLAFILVFQNRLFSRLTRDIRKFERNNRVRIN